MKASEPDKTRFLATILGELPDRVPNFEVLIEAPAVSHILGREIPHHTLSFDLPPEDYIQLANAIGQDLIGCNFFMWPFMRRGEDGNPLTLSELPAEAVAVGPFYDGGISRSDGFERIYAGPEKTLSFQLDAVREQWDRYVRAVEGTSIGLFALTGMLLQTIYQFTVGFENFMLLLYDEPDFIEDLLDKSTDFHRAIVEFLCDYPLDVLYLADDVAYRSGLMIHPRRFLKMWVPRMKRVMEPAVRKGIPIIFHSDGTLYDLIPSLIEMGFKSLNPVEPYGMDIYQVKEKWGDEISIMGNMDIAGVLAFGTPDEVRRDTEQHLDALMPGGRYIAASSHSITSAVPPENFLAMVETVHSKGRYS